MYLACDAQSTTVKILDVAVTPVMYASMVNPPSSADSTELLIQFKINSASQALDAKLLFGTTQDVGDVLSLQPVFSQSGGNYFLNLNGENFPVTGYNARVRIKLSPQQMQALAFLTLFVTDVNGLPSNKLYFKF
jgi:hypothetical protein